MAEQKAVAAHRAALEKSVEKLAARPLPDHPAGRQAVSVPMKPTDPAYWMLEQGRADPSKRSTTTVYRAGCYICDDPEFVLMGLPLCYPCSKRKGHVAADDSRCDDCSHDQQEDNQEGEASDGVEL